MGKLANPFLFYYQIDHIGFLDLVNISLKYENIDWAILGALLAF